MQLPRHDACCRFGHSVPAGESYFTIVPSGAPRSPYRTLKHIRPATDCDLIAVARIYENAIRTAEWLPDSARQNAEFAAASAGEVVYVWYSENAEVQGFVSVWKPESFVHHLYVAPRYQGRGAGTALLASLADWLPRPWTLKCADANAYALSFYLARGWKVIGNGDGEHGSYSVLEYSGEPSGECTGGLGVLHA